MNRRQILIQSVLSLLLVAAASAQTDLRLPEASQAAEIKQRVGVTDVTITYHRPLVNGRKIWGGLVPLGQVWRAGANKNTTIEFSTLVQVEGKSIPAGTYGLHMIPTSDQWTIIFSKMSAAWGSYTYSETEDAIRVTAKQRDNAMEEALAYSFDDLKADSVVVTMKWEKLAVAFRISVTDAETVLPSLRNELRGRAQYSWGPPNEAASYCLTKKIALDEGLKWAELSIQNEERFENLSTKADLLKALNKPDEAKTVWSRALEIGAPIQLYSQARRMQSEKREAEAMELLQMLAKRSPQNVFGLLAQTRLKSAAGDFAGAGDAAKQALAVAINDQQKQNIKNLIDRLEKKQDINK